VFSREIRAAAFPQRFRQPSTIVKYNGETDPSVWLNDYRLACQLGGATSDEVIIRNLPLHLGDSARTWLEHPSVAQSEIVHAFLEGTTCRDLVRELGRSPPADSNELFDIATSFASEEEAVGAIFDGKKGKRSDDAPAEDSKSREPHRKDKRGKKGRSRTARRASRGATTMMPRPLLLTRLDEALDRPLEARGCSMTC
jgi:hypothetical protein